MVRKEYHSAKVNGIAGGSGPALMEYWLAGDELSPNSNMMATVTLEPGSSVGIHPHEGEAEIYRIISGTGIYNDNGTPTEVGEGFVTICYNSEQHGLENTGDVPLVFDAVIIAG